MLRIVLFICFLIFTFNGGFGQILINEIMSSNGSVVPDEDGDFSDWIELVNAGDQPVNLEGWSLSDDGSLLSKWQFPSKTLVPNEYLLVFASDKDRRECCYTWTTVIDKGDDWFYKDGSEVESLSWIDVNFTLDTTWKSGPTTLGYDQNNEDNIATEIAPTISLFLRKNFSISGVAEVIEAKFHVDYDDAFVAYLNGVEIARSGIQGERPANNELGDDHEAVLYQGGLPSSFNIKNEILIEGENVLAIQVHNSSLNSSDLSITPFFSIKKYGEDGNSSPLLDLPDNYFHTNFKIKSAGENLYLSDNSGSIVDNVIAVALLADISYGRIPGESNSWGYFYSPTPGNLNETLSYQNIINQAPSFDNEAGYFSGTEIIKINQVQDYQIHYTLDGSIPSQSSPLYTEPFQVHENTVIKASFFKDDFPPGPVGTLSMIHESSITGKNLPFLSISADPDQLFSEAEGLFLNMPGELEKPVYIELFEPDGSLAFGANAGMKIFGNESEEGYDYQQSLSFFARAKYGDGSFNYRLFKEKNIESFEAFIVRNNNSVYDLYDGVGNGLVQDILDVQAYQPVVLFVNGEYWGIENMMEKINEHYLASNFLVDPDSVDLLNGIETDVPFYNPEWVMSGDIDHYVSMIDFMREHDLASDVNFNVVESMMDIDNFATYQCVEIFLGNQDWPGNNMKWWRPKSEDGRWRWIFFDMDAGLGAWVDYNDNTLLTAVQPDGPKGGEGTWPNPPWSTFILRKLLENDEFKNLFIATMCDLLATNFDPDKSIKWVGARENPVIREMPSHLDRWDFDQSVKEWTFENNQIRNFLIRRPQAIRTDFLQYFNLGQSKELRLDIRTGGGQIQVNNRLIEETNWTGQYFENLKIKLKAIPDIGFEFDGWEGLNIESPETSVIMDEDHEITGKFRPISSFERIVINEICFSNAPEGDWLELYNPTAADIDLTQWSIVDDGSTPFIFPNGTVIGPDQYLVVCRNTDDFQQEYGSVPSVGELGFGLSKRGDLVILRNKLNETIDMVEYKVVFPWPEFAGSISLFEPDVNNASPYYWHRSDFYKTPGAENLIVTALEGNEEGTIVLDHPYPNPFSDKLTITYKVHKKQNVLIRLLDMSGSLIRVLIDEELAPGTYSVEINARDQSDGLYLIMLDSPEGSITKRVFSYSN